MGLIFPANHSCGLHGQALSSRKYEAFAELALGIHMASLESASRWFILTSNRDSGANGVSFVGSADHLSYYEGGSLNILTNPRP